MTRELITTTLILLITLTYFSILFVRPSLRREGRIRTDRRGQVVPAQQVQDRCQSLVELSSPTRRCVDRDLSAVGDDMVPRTHLADLQ
jgi:hypothetical protein